MLRFVASFFTSNIKTSIPDTYEENSQETGFHAKNDPFFITREEFFKVSSNEEEQPEEMDIHSLRQKRLQELAQKALLRKISHQAVLNHYAQDHLPLSELQEKLREDDIPLKVLQDKLKQKENLSTYTTIRENINFLLYSKPSKPKKSRPTLSTPLTTDDTTNNNDVSTKDIRDYDVWDDAIIGRLMNLIDTIGIEDIVGTSEGTETIPTVNSELIDKVVKEVVKEAMEGEPKNEYSGVDDKENFIFLKESTDTIGKVDKETIVAESSTAAAVAIENNAMEDVKYNVVEDKVMNDNDAEDVENDVMENVENNDNTMEDLQEDIQKKTKRESIKIAEELIDFGETINVAESLLLSDSLKNDVESLSSIKSVKKSRRSIFSLASSSNNNKNPVPAPKSLKRNASDLNRKCSIHSKKSYESNLSRRSSISSKFSVNTVTSTMIVEESEEGSDNIKFRKRGANKSLRFLKQIWKNNQLANNDEEFIPNNEITERYYKQSDGVQSNHELRRNRVEGPETIGTADANGYSNFYLSMPNGKWMVRTRTASRKITGTLHVDKEYI